jgi:hypothetical protein
MPPLRHKTGARDWATQAPSLGAYPMAMFGSSSYRDRSDFNLNYECSLIAIIGDAYQVLYCNLLFAKILPIYLTVRAESQFLSLTPKPFSYFQLTELTLADGSARGQVKNDKRCSKEQQR